MTDRLLFLGSDSEADGHECPCDGDANGEGVVYLFDAACVRDFAGHVTCACCVNSCDLNCDGVVDAVDTAPGPLHETVWQLPEPRASARAAVRAR